MLKWDDVEELLGGRTFAVSLLPGKLQIEILM